MSYAQLVNDKVALAFRLIKDLAVDVTLNRKSNSFDFASGNSSSTNVDVPTKAVITTSSKKNERNTTLTEMMFKTQDVGDIKSIDTVTISGAIWKVKRTISNDQYVTVLEIAKEV